MELTKLEKKVLPIIGIILSFILVKDKGAVTILLVAASYAVTYLLTLYWQPNQ